MTQIQIHVKLRKKKLKLSLNEAFPLFLSIEAKSSPIFFPLWILINKTFLSFCLYKRKKSPTHVSIHNFNQMSKTEGNFPFIICHHWVNYMEVTHHLNRYSAFTIKTNAYLPIGNQSHKQYNSSNSAIVWQRNTMIFQYFIFFFHLPFVLFYRSTLQKRTM